MIVVCPHCLSSFQQRATRGGALVYCSAECSNAARVLKKSSPLTSERLRDLLVCDASTGRFSWRVPSRGRSGEAGWIDDNGYQHIRVDGRLYLGHRLAWFWVHGEWPPSGIDHKEGTAVGDAMSNLRPANQSQNTANSRRSKANTTGLKGVSRRRGRWRATITKDRCQVHLGDFDTPEAAHAAYCAAAVRLHGEFARSA